MKLHIITETGLANKLTAYHITTLDALPKVLETGLTAGNRPRLGKTGYGVYVFFLPNNSLEMVSTMAEYLGIMSSSWALVQVRVDEESLLMDEDTISYDYCYDELVAAYPEVAKEYEQIVYSSKDEIEIRHKCIDLIDKYEIRPIPKLSTRFGRYHFIIL
jgi:hypothetical protein